MRWTIISLLFLFTFIVLIPGLIKPQLIFERNNDLNEFFWPIFQFTKNHIFVYKSLPIWNNSILSGYPMISDPQAPLFYLPNAIFLFVPMDLGFLMTIVLHISAGGLGIYICSRQIFKFSKLTALFTAFLYISTPRLIGYIDAGHIGLIYSSAWIPYVLLSTFNLFRFPSFKWITFLAFSLAGIFFTHTFTFVIIIFSSFFLYLIFSFLKLNNMSKIISLIYLLISYLILLGLISVSLFPQIEWSSQTTRFLLFNKPDVYPKWQSLTEFILSATNPILLKIPYDTEKWIAIGVVPLILALLGLVRLKNRYKVLCLIALSAVVLISLNNLLPFYQILLKQNWFVLLRVTTRVWIIFILITIFLAGFYLEMIKSKKTLVIVLISLSLTELIILSWFKILLPILNTRNLAPEEVYSFIKHDQQRFRIFCTTGCLSPLKVVHNNFETIEGYNTLQQLNYYKHAWELTKSYWDYYSLYLPPLGVTTFERLQPSSKSLGEYNVKYIISPHPLEDNGFELAAQFKEFKIYRNNNFKQRVYFQKPSLSQPILSFYSPNYIKINLDNTQGQLILADVYSKGWKAFTEDNIEVEILETPNALRAINVPKNTSFIEFKYFPQSFLIGLLITFITYFLLISLFIFKKNVSKS